MTTERDTPVDLIHCCVHYNMLHLFYMYVVRQGVTKARFVFVSF